VRAFGIGTETPIGKMYGVNLGCIDALDDEALSRLSITYVDAAQTVGTARRPFCSHL